MILSSLDWKDTPPLTLYNIGDMYILLDIVTSIVSRV